MTMNKQLRKLVVFLLDESREVALVLLVVFSLPAAVYTSLFFIELMVSGGVGDPEKVLDFVRMTRFFLPSAIVVLLSSILIIGTYVYSWLHDHRENTNRVPIIHHLYIAAGYQYDGRNYSRFWLYPAPWPITVAMRVAGLIGLVCMLIAIAATFPKSVLLAAAVVLGLFAIRSHIRKTNRE